ncbi:uncharacterized protein LOC113643298 [Tachysurus fulvidraco]|uniref:uncharacterized protein LOC113643298 n=1 Tax=Tachysurus fulvidraco TaxID=1234273 RepID=UPI001FEFAE94|nr:uncharacterized protein LOC113643298 [Tachysurus fulvidraco]
MTEASISVDHDQFICSVCLDLLKDPVTLSCGHSFCKICINSHWDKEDQKGIYSCPQCRDTFTPRPVLRRNNMLAEVVEKLKKKTEVQAASPAHCYAGPGDVECDFCTRRKYRAVKSCLVCVASFCETHLKPHLEIPALKKHTLMEASGNLQEKICSEHDEVLKIFCRTDQRCICSLCLLDKHKGHDVASVTAGRAEKQSELKEQQMKFQQRHQEKQKKVQELKQAVDTIKLSAQTAVEDNEIIFTEMISSMEKKRSEVTEMIRAQEKAELSRTERLLEQLEQEIDDLQRRLTEMEKLSHTHDHIHFLQALASGPQSPLLNKPEFDTSSISVPQHLSFDGVRNSLSELKKRLEEFCEEELNKIPPHAAAVQIISPPDPQNREEFLKYFCSLTLDYNTSHYNLILSEKNRVVTVSKRKQQYSDHPERFDTWWQVLCKESVCGRSYWEVEWSGDYGVSISVSYKDIRRKGDGTECVFGRNKQSWSLRCSSRSLSFYHDNIMTDVRGPSSSRIGVYVDHRAGTLSFYNVSHTMKLLHRFLTTFTQPLYAGFTLSLLSKVRLCDPQMILAIFDCYATYLKAKKQNKTFSWVYWTKGRESPWFRKERIGKCLWIFMKAAMEQFGGYTAGEDYKNIQRTQNEMSDLSFSHSLCEFRKMAEASISVDQHQFSCPVCLDLLKDPVTIPCGHSFCKVCINGCWDQEDQKDVYSCPECRDTFTPRPVLRRNNMLAEVVEKLKKKTEVQAASPAHCYPRPGDVECDFCTGRKHKAVKFCVVCVASFCETHLKPHLEIPALKKHTLMEASGNLQEKICSEHDEVLKIFCRTDQRCICSLCLLDKHKGHKAVSVTAGTAEKQGELNQEQMKFQQRLQEKQKKVQELKQTVNTIKLSAQTAVEDNERIFTELISFMEKKRSEVTEMIRAQEKAELSRAERLLKQLEQEIDDLQRRVTEMEKLSHTHDHIHFLQALASGHQSPLLDRPDLDTSSIRVSQHLSFDGVRNFLSDLKKILEEFCEEEFCEEEFNKIRPHAAAVQIISPPEPQNREEFLKYFCSLTLDPNTTHYNLILSEKNRAMTVSMRQQKYSDHPERFDTWWQVLCKESVCGRSYWEVEWSGDGIVSISVSYKDIRRKGRGDECRLGRNKQSFSLECSPSSSSLFYHNNIMTDLRVPSSPRIGVYVDHSAGTLSFYSVSHTMKLLHRVHTTFTQPLYAGFTLSLLSKARLCDPQ